MGLVLRRRLWIARGLALVVDVIQWAAMPVFLPGALSPANAIVDLLAAAALVRLVGWNWAFLPSFVAELVPGLDLFPTWTAAVLWATRGHDQDTPPPNGALPSAPDESPRQESSGG